MSAVIPMMIETIMLSSLTGFVIKSPDKTKTIPTANVAFPSFVTNSFTLSHPSLIIYLRITQKQMIALPITFETAKKSGCFAIYCESSGFSMQREVLPITGSCILRANLKNQRFARNRRLAFTGRFQKSPICP